MANIGVIETNIFNSLREIEKNLILIQENLNTTENLNTKKIKKIKKSEKLEKVSQKNEKNLNWERETNDIPDTVNLDLVRTQPIKKKRRRPKKKIAFSNYVVDTSSSSED
tara:strand:+ start:68 stop:397 length:330 start_codon:yes stop_codon:yes gene_type:complete